MPSYALIVRDYFPANQAATRISIVVTATVAGMAVGGWMSGALFDMTGTYQAAFLNGVAWNVPEHGHRRLAAAHPFPLRRRFERPPACDRVNTPEVTGFLRLTLVQF